MSADHFTMEPAVEADAVMLAELHCAVADHLTGQHGRGPWSTHSTEKGVLYGMRISKVFVMREGEGIIATFHLGTKKPWAIDRSYFTPCKSPLYLVSMAVAPAKQRQGLGRRCLEEAQRLARAWPADAIRFDAYDAAAGAGTFYSLCGAKERGRVVYRGTPLVYFEYLLA